MSNTGSLATEGVPFVNERILSDIHDGEEDDAYHVPDSDGYCQKCGYNLLHEGSGELCQG